MQTRLRIISMWHRVDSHASSCSWMSFDMKQLLCKCICNWKGRCRNTSILFTPPQFRISSHEETVTNWIWGYRQSRKAKGRSNLNSSVLFPKFQIQSSQKSMCWLPKTFMVYCPTQTMIASPLCITTRHCSASHALPPEGLRSPPWQSHRCGLQLHSILKANGAL